MPRAAPARVLAGAAAPPRRLASRAAALALVAALGAGAAPSAGEGRPSEFRIVSPKFALDSFRWRAAATPQGTVVATNEWGDLRVRTAHRGGLVVSAMIQKIGSGEDELEVRVDEHLDRVVVAVVPRVATPRGRVDLTVIVPAGKRLEVTTRDGVAEVKYQGDVAVRTRGGAVTLLTPGHAVVESDTGDLEAKLSAQAWRQPLSLVTRRGDVTLWLPRDANATLRAATAGPLEVAFPHRVAASAAVPAVESTLGAGGAALRVESADGTVRVLPYVEVRSRG